MARLSAAAINRRIRSSTVGNRLSKRRFIASLSIISSRVYILNQIEVERLDAADLRQREPNIIGVGGFSSRRRASSTSSECAREWLASFARQEPRSNWASPSLLSRNRTQP